VQSRGRRSFPAYSGANPGHCPPSLDIGNAPPHFRDDAPLGFETAVDLYLVDMRVFGRLTSERSRAEYRRTLRRHAEDAEGRGPSATTCDDVKATLRRWTHPNTQRRMRSMLVSFYDWLVEEGLRPDNRARQIRSPRGRESHVRTLTLEEVRRFLAAARGRTERRVAYLGVCAGLRRNELRQLRGRHFARERWILVSGDIAKGHRERWVPVMADLEPVVREIRETTPPEHFVLPATRWVAGERGLVPVECPELPCDVKTIWRTVRRIGRRAGIGVAVHPHLLRHAFASHVTRLAGLHVAQAMLGHASIQTTQGYLARPSPDELAAALAAVTFRMGS
jgi:site-specific recombinase XerD